MLDSLQRLSSLPSSDLKPTSDLDAIDSGILFGHATWSGPSFVAFRTLTEVVADLVWRPDLYIADIDELSDAALLKLGALLPSWGGWGETFWIVDGVLRDAFNAYRSNDATVQITRITRAVFPGD